MTVGITGGIGSGKSWIARILEAMNYPVFHSDEVAKEIMQSDEVLRSEIIAYFGTNAFEDGRLNRSYLASKIFLNPEDREVINELVHPKVRMKFEQFAQDNSHAHVFNEAAILFETGAYRNFDKTLLVTAPIDLRIQRVMLRDNCSEDEVVSRMKNQWEDERKIALADFCIVNDEKQPLLTQVEEVLDLLNTYSTSS